MKLVGAGSSKCHGSNIHGNTPSNQCARSVLVSFTALSMLSPGVELRFWPRQGEEKGVQARILTKARKRVT